MSHTNKFIIYKRVSGGKNQKSGLGLDAQTDEINIYLQAQTNYQIVANILKLSLVNHMKIDQN